MNLITQNISPNKTMKTLILPISMHIYLKHMRGIQSPNSVDTTTYEVRLEKSLVLTLPHLSLSTI